MAPYQAYNSVPQGLTSPVPLPMQSYNPPLKTGYPTGQMEYYGYDGAQVRLTGNHHKLLLKENDLVSHRDTTGIPLTDFPKNLKIRIRILRVLLRFAATCFAIGTATQEGITLSTYLRTRNHIEGGRGPWALKTELWTSILLFVVSMLTMIVGVIMIAAYLISIRAANKVSSVQTYFAVAAELGHIGLWIGVAVTYRVSL